MKNMKRLYVTGLALLCFSVVLFAGIVPAQADVWWDWTWDNMMEKTGNYGTATNGWITINATNNTASDWGDFHMEILDIGQGSVDNVHFEVGTFSMMPSPDSSQTFTYNIDNTSVGATIDFFFYGDPVTIGNSGTFKVFVSNPDTVLFGIVAYPSVVPEPVSSTLFLVGAVSLGVRRFWKKRNAA